MKLNKVFTAILEKSPNKGGWTYVVMPGSAEFFGARGAVGTGRRLMAAADVDEYIDGLEEPKRSTLDRLRRDILAVVPDVEQCISYGAPGFKVAGKTIAGFAAFKNHLSYLPHSGSVFPELAADLTGYRWSSGALRFPVDQPLRPELVRKLVTVRLRQAFAPSPGDTTGPSD